MKDLDEELWKLGILAKTEHNEVAPAQHELAPIFTTANISADHNQLTMEMMKKVAVRHNLVCILHEKPFAGVNGSGKHNNWSISTNTGVNLLEPGDSPHENAQFLLFLCAVIKAVDEYQDLLRISVASAGNDHRLGANEAPPAIISMFLGDELTEVLQSIETGSDCGAREHTVMKVGVHVLPRFPKDTTDRNRTSPFAFTGNKFEFRMPGSALSISGPNIILNTIVAEELSQFADALEGAEDFRSALGALIQKVIREHKRIIFNGNNYSEEWVEEAERRGLYNLKTTADAMPYFVSEKNVALFTKHKIFTEAEMQARFEISLDNYCKVLHIEALTMLDMARKDILPACLSYAQQLSNTAQAKKALSSEINCTPELALVTKISSLCACLYKKADRLETLLQQIRNCDDISEKADFYKDSALTAMLELRAVADELEANTAESLWPFPSYGKLLFSVS